MIDQKLISSLKINKKEYFYLDFNKVSTNYNLETDKLPITLRILLENSLRNVKKTEETELIISKFKDWLEKAHNPEEILYYPSRILMQDFTGVPAVVDLAAMRYAVNKNGANPKKINPISPVDLVIDHSIQVDKYGTATSLEQNTELEIQRNYERYEFLKWGQTAFDNFRAVPPGTGICHQVNLEYLAPVIGTREISGKDYLIPDTLVGTDSHTTMINGIGVLGWGVGGIEAEAAMLGKAISMLIPDVVGFKLTGKLAEGITATDLVLTITQKLRETGVVGKFVEFYGDALDNLSVADRATIANMSPEFGSTCGYFPIDDKTLAYLYLSGRSEEQIELVKEYAKINHLWRSDQVQKYSNSIELDLNIVEASLAGPKRPQDLVKLSDISNNFKTNAGAINFTQKFPVKEHNYELQNGNIVIAAITSCTNTSNPSVMLAAGLVAKKALEKGLKPKPYVKTSLGPGSQVVAAYYKKSGLQKYLDEFGFNIVGFGCTTCIGNSGPLKAEIEETIKNDNLHVASILSGNRNFEGRVHPLTKSNYLASPPLIVAYSILGTVTKDITTESLGTDQDGNEVYLRDIWPSNQEISEAVSSCVTREMFIEKYQSVFDGEAGWQAIKVKDSETYEWNENSTYIQNPPFFEHNQKLTNINNANILALFGDSITTDHISPAGAIAGNSPAAEYLALNGIAPQDFNSYGSRRGNHEVMMRGTFANIRIKNEMMQGKEGGYTVFAGSETNIYDAAMQHKLNNTPLVIVAGKEYGTGSSRDWAAKGTFLLGVKAVIAESFERIHRSNLVGMAVLPLMFQDNVNRKSLKLNGSETITITDLDKITPLGEVVALIKYQNGVETEIKLTVRIDTPYEMENFVNGGVLNSVVKQFSAK
ncbi:MAG: aconitate hydratase AcnA [Alphaproteobacteria bacterium]|nr:aconitate hydratase AcnA [Alphaproteobacteria bacterium]MBT5827951.1 aconitate hydratase AcnA [Alphaproteobacteria bacterium]